MRRPGAPASDRSVFPAPEAPTTATRSPEAIAKSTSCSTRWPVVYENDIPDRVTADACAPSMEVLCGGAQLWWPGSLCVCSSPGWQQACPECDEGDDSEGQHESYHGADYRFGRYLARGEKERGKDREDRDAQCN